MPRSERCDGVHVLVHVDELAGDVRNQVQKEQHNLFVEHGYVIFGYELAAVRTNGSVALNLRL